MIHNLETNLNAKTWGKEAEKRVRIKGYINFIILTKLNTHNAKTSHIHLVFLYMHKTLLAKIYFTTFLSLDFIYLFLPPLFF